MILPFRAKKTTDAEVVASVLRHDQAAIERFYVECKRYFKSHAAAIFVTDDNMDDIFQEAMIHLWREIETRRIELSNGQVCRWVEGELQPMTSSLTTFLMAVAKRKRWEQVRRDRLMPSDDLEILARARYGLQPPAEVDEPDLRERIVADCVLQMSDRCRQILSLFYYEERTLDEILALRPENNSKVGLKTSKYKCMNRLREMVREKFRQYHL